MIKKRNIYPFTLIVLVCGLVLLRIFSRQLAWTAETAGNHIGLLVSKRFQGDEVLFRDYGHLMQYRNANAQLLPSPNRVILVGDSITDFWTDPEKSHIAYEEPYFVFRGVGGSNTGQMLLRFRQDVIDLHPRVVVILAGTNDILIRDDDAAFKNFRDNIETMCEMAMDRHISLILGSIPPLTDTGNQADPHHMRSIPIWNAWLRSYAQSIGAGFTDYYSLLVGQQHEFRSDLTYDDIHPNRAGYSLMQPLLHNEVKHIESSPKHTEEHSSTSTAETPPAVPLTLSH